MRNITPHPAPEPRNIMNRSVIATTATSADRPANGSETTVGEIDSQLFRRYRHHGHSHA
jgi:hypothetical protein